MDKLVLKDSNQMDAAIIAARNAEDRIMIAQQMIDSGIVPKSFTEPSAVVAACEMGAELGLKPYVALNNIYVIQGRPTLSAASMVALVQSRGVAVKVLEDCKAFEHADGTEDARTTIKIYRKIKELDMVMEYDHSKSWAECEIAGWTEKENWSKYPKNMLRARTISEALRLYCADILQGIYSTDEILDTMDVSYELTEDLNIENIEENQS
jgi:hypothetical protein